LGDKILLLNIYIVFNL